MEKLGFGGEGSGGAYKGIEIGLHFLPQRIKNPVMGRIAGFKISFMGRIAGTDSEEQEQEEEPYTVRAGSASYATTLSPHPPTRTHIHTPLTEYFPFGPPSPKL